MGRRAPAPADGSARGRAARAAVGALLLLGLLLRLPGLPLLGTGDAYIWKLWAYVTATRGLTRAYPIKGRTTWPPLTLASLDQVRSGRILPGWNTYVYQPHRRPADPPERKITGPTDYPPGTLLLLWGVGGLYQAVFAPDFADSPTLNVLIKGLLVLADAAIAGLIYAAVRRRAGPSRRLLPLVAAAAYWCNPTAILAGSVLAYFDALYSVPLVAGLALLAAGRYAAGWAGWAVALLVKVQALVLGPTFALLSLRQGVVRLAGYAALAAGVATVFCTPFVLRGTFVGVLAGVGANTPGLGAATYEDYLSANQCNLWWLWSYFWEWHAEGMGPGALVRIVPPTKIQQLGVADLNLWGEALFAGFFLLTSAIWWLGSRGRGAGQPLRVADLFLVPLQFYGATMLLPSIHENHLLLALPLLALLMGLAAAGGTTAQGRRLAFLYGALSLEVGLNLLLFYGFGKGASAPLPRMWFGVDATVPLAAANVVLFATCLAAWAVPLLAGLLRARPSAPAGQPGGAAAL